MSKHKYPIVLMSWVDITGHADTWTEKRDLKAQPTKVKSVGWLVKETDEYVVLAEGYSHDHGFNQCSTFPKGCIKSMKVIG